MEVAVRRVDERYREIIIMDFDEHQKIDSLLFDAPCIFCNYDGAGFYQAGTHKKSCPWHSVGGYSERLDFFINRLENHKVIIDIN